MDDDAERRAGAETLRALLALHRARNGRLATNRASRRAQARWRMYFVDGEFYDRARLRAALADQRRRSPQAAPVVPHSRRALTAAELAALDDANPWRLAQE